MIKCEKCLTENEEKYEYCKNCGNLLKTQPESIYRTEAAGYEQQTASSENIKADNVQTNPYYFNNNGQFALNDFGEVTSEEMSLFIGKNSHKFLPKFSKMELSGSKVSWCWPAAILGYIFGPFGSAFWFFYRKMYKPAIIFSVIGSILIIITTALTFNVNNRLLEAFENADSFDEVISVMEEFIYSSELNSGDALLSSISSAIDNIAGIASCIVAGIFGMYFYKNHCKKRILEYRNTVADQRYYKIGLTSVGGTSVGMLIVGIVSFFVVSEIVSFITLLINNLI